MGPDGGSHLLFSFCSSLCFQFLLPVIQISLICLCVGGDPRGIKVAVVNNETSATSYSKSLLSFLDNSSVHQVGIPASAASAFMFDSILSTNETVGKRNSFIFKPTTLRCSVKFFCDYNFMQMGVKVLVHAHPQVPLSYKDAFEGIHNGEYWGVIGFSSNFTSYLTKR